ncbi:Rco1p KNAG_0C05760 [Huiozyma naganishii CBS 8797]|uniref:PHD-type domain-containing protein n=1 Tax=Huiozyma naganishii (strain ATCC MYA-139 / BCRC 22969 / CBS 8797 / KCTC 17520 / NBRC 10181 / NCYC 3082 / Yp74L-3) TaxID=1071383 RepID=J7S554_HUIN7|nr:hypothetical protein KNAG_0C05760 [Kazachstania naganishii CBS 8797]CCK69674.1 hypothetical protein KNAG_0C05760 [Kazachstania naganishii CBS 8797]
MNDRGLPLSSLSEDAAKSKNLEKVLSATSTSHSEPALSGMVKKRRYSKKKHASPARERPKRSSSLKVDYDLKKRRVISSDDFYSDKKLRELRLLNMNHFSYKSKQGGLLPNGGSNGSFTGTTDAATNNNNSTAKNVEADIINGATGLPLSALPTDKIKKERLWNFKKSSPSGSTALSLLSVRKGSLATSSPADSLKEVLDLTRPEVAADEDTVESRLYQPLLKTEESRPLTKPSNIRSSHNLQDDEAEEDLLSYDDDTKMGVAHAHVNTHVKSKPLSSKNKLFNQNSFNVEVKEEEKNSDFSKVEEIENDDFCSACLQSGSFLCCDTCPKSFHFLCLDPPIDPSNLPEGDWSCPSCEFKSQYATNTQYKKGQKQFIQEAADNGTNKLFSKLLFQLQGFNPKQFNLPQSVKESFPEVSTGDRGQYTDDTMRTPLTEKQMFNSPYGQSITKLDSYCPENHYIDDNSDTTPDRFLLCYKCKTTKFGTWDHPGNARLLIKCDYCQTPWHLDCIPDVPRASLKILGYKWRCPLHANVKQQRRLNKRQQKYLEPSQPCGYKNTGDIEIVLDEISSPDYKAKPSDLGQMEPVPLLKESGIKLDFMDKIYNYQKSMRKSVFKLQERLLDRIISNSEDCAELNEISSLLYFKYCSVPSQPLKSLWDFKELCFIADKELVPPTNKGSKQKESVPPKEDEAISQKNASDICISSEEVSQLLLIKKILETKRKDEVMKFFDLK